MIWTLHSYPKNNAIGDFIREKVQDPSLAHLLNQVAGILGLVVLVSLSGLILIWLERKVCAHFQARLGPMRVGFHGLLQSLADGLKLLLKEVMKPEGADTFLFYLAPLLPMTSSFLILAVIPFDHHLQLTDLNLGVLYVIGFSGLGILGLLIGGWASNNKYSLLGSLRSGAQMISYEVSIALGMLVIVLLSGTTSLREIVLSQEGPIWNWWIFKAGPVGILAAILFIVASTAELNRGPFDIAEAESELTAGFHTEYSGISFSMFFLSEFINMFIAGSLVTVFFLGGFLAPEFGFTQVDLYLSYLPGFVWFFLKAYFVIFLFMWFRWTFPRLRVDQLMLFEWKFLLPANLFNLGLAALFISQGWVYS